VTACARCSFDPDAIVSASWMLLIDREIESGNRHTYNVGGSRFRYARDRDSWQWEFRSFRLLRKIPRATGKRRLTLTRFYDGRQREMDVDNLSTGAKLVVDALVREGLLVDDRREFAEVHYKQARQAPRGTGVLLEELTTPPSSGGAE
jgi:Holliday junction resolvase RusA-like endonuclease